MKKLLSLLFVLAMVQQVFAIDASLSYASFKSPQSTYIEIYLYVIGKSVTFKEIAAGSSEKQAAVEMNIVFKKNDQIFLVERVLIKSPLDSVAVNFSDVRRLAIPHGEYKLEVQLIDHNQADNSIVLGEDVTIMNPDISKISDIQLLATFKKTDAENAMVKNGVFMEQIPFHFYNKNYQQIPFYFELYSGTIPENSADLLLKYSIVKILGNGTREELAFMYKKRAPKSVDPVLLQMDLSKVPSGNYALSVELMAGPNEVIEKKESYFIRSNPDMDYELFLASKEIDVNAGSEDFTEGIDSAELRYSLRAIVPNVSQKDAEVLKLVISKSNINAMRAFLRNHFESTYKDNPKLAYKKYMEVARAVDKQYGNGFGFGFESDRGYYFMKYGKPDDIQAIIDDPTAPPYEIWFYNKLVTTNQSNVKFIFYNPTLIENGHTLLHSTARGEWNNPKWEVMLYSNSPNQREGDNFIDGNQMQDNWGRNARRYFDDY
jgi:GWxTD domain-containing protein